MRALKIIFVHLKTKNLLFYLQLENSNLMKKTIYSIYLIIGLCAIAFSAWGQVNQPVYGQNITVQVTDLQKFYDMGGSANTAPDCQETDMIND